MIKICILLLTVFVLTSCSQSGSTIDQSVAVTATYSSISQNILTPGCTGCHGTSGGYSFETYAGTMQAVVSGSAATSPLYTAINTGRMPKNGNAPSVAQLAAIAAWINAGAPNN